MATDDRLFLGFDPGGHGKFGVASLVNATVRTSTVNSVTQAIAWARSLSGYSHPLAAGIDTLLHWSDGPSGWRPADRWLIETYSATAKSVVSPNGLFGAMAVGGMGLALRLRHHWPEIALNETHPKVVIPAMGGQRYKDIQLTGAIAWFCQQSRLEISESMNGHEFDALLSAWVTRCGIDHQWNDIVGDDPSLLRPAGNVTYLWPPATFSIENYGNTSKNVAVSA